MNACSSMPSSTRSPQRASVVAERPEVLLDVVEHTEVDEREVVRRVTARSRGSSPPTPRGRSRRGTGRHDEPGALEPDARPRPRVERPVPVQIRDVVPRVPGVGKQSSPEDAAADDVHVLSGNRRQLAPELVERSRRVAARSRRVSSGRADGGADLGDVDLQRGCSRTSTPAAPAWSRWMCERRR
jgi:hypothetical protein